MATRSDEEINQKKERTGSESKVTRKYKKDNKANWVILRNGKGEGKYNVLTFLYINKHAATFAL